MLALNRVKVAAFQALERNVATLGLEAGMIAAIIVDPQAEEYRGDKEAIDDRGGYEIHAGEEKIGKGRSMPKAERFRHQAKRKAPSSRRGRRPVKSDEAR